MVKRSDIKLKRGPSYPCQTCDFAAKSVAALRKHKKNDHVLGLNSSNKMKEPRHSTRNNSVIEHLMIEDISSTDLESRNGNPLEENSLKYTCNECNYITTNKAHIDDHVKSQHLLCDNEEVQFVCIICKHEFKEAEDYDTHVKIHDGQSEAENKEFNQLNNFSFNDILEHLAYETQNDNKCKCKKCELKTNRKDSNRAHKKTMHQQSKAKTVGVKCALCQYEFRSNVELEEHHDHEHSKKTETEQETETENIPGFNNLDKNDRKNILFNHLAEQNADLMEEVINMKKAMKKMFTQMINDFEEGMDSLKDVTKKNNIETKKALMNMEKKIDKLSRATKATPASSVSSTGPVSSPKTSSKPSKAKDLQNHPKRSLQRKRESL